MVTIASHTLVKNGMPFIDLVLRQAIPFVNRSLITVSRKSDDGTLEVVQKLQSEFPDKVFVDFEEISSPGELTGERQKQVEKTTEDWIWFLDDDDYWPTESIELMRGLIEMGVDVDGYSISPYQVVSKEHHDGSWSGKFFLKFFKNQPGINYRHPWPRDLIYLNDTLLYWKGNHRVPRIGRKMFYHLSNVKDHSFRSEDWAKRFKDKIGAPVKFPEDQMKHIWKIYEQFNKHP